jgi:methionine-rich copper-binding protein CopC
VRKAVAVGAIAILSFLVISPASANSLVNSSPISGSSLLSPPSAVTITTQVALLDVGNSVTVKDPKGKRVDDGALTVDGVNVIIGLKPLTVSGIYTVTYAVEQSGPPARLIQFHLFCSQRDFIAHGDGNND